MKNWQELKKLIAYSEGGILSKHLFKSSKLGMDLFCMAKGTKMSEHTSTREAIVHVIEGKGVFRLGKENIPMLPGVIIHMKPNAKHALKADENTSFVLILMN
jgi:quercetin dioxygenase-like cupin family protein